MPQPAPFSFSRTYAQKTSNGPANGDPQTGRRRRPVTAAVPRYMQDTAVSRQRTLFYGLIEVDPRTPSNGAARSPARRRASENAAAESSPRIRSLLMGRPVTGVESNRRLSGGVSLPRRDSIDRPPTDGGGEAPKDVDDDDGAGKDRSDSRIVVEEVTVSLPLPPSDPRRPPTGSSALLSTAAAAAGRCSPPDSTAAVRLPDIINNRTPSSSEQRRGTTDTDHQPPVGDGDPQHERHAIGPRRRESGTDGSASSPVDRREAKTGSSAQQQLAAAAATLTDLQSGARTPVGARTMSLKWSVPSEASPSSGSSQNVRLYRRRNSKINSCTSNDNSNNNNNNNIIEGTISDGSVFIKTNGKAFYGSSMPSFERHSNRDAYLISTNETYPNDCVTTNARRNDDDEDDDCDSEIFLPSQRNEAKDDLVFHSNGDILQTLGKKTRCQTGGFRGRFNRANGVFQPYNQRPVEKRNSCVDFSVPSRYPPPLGPPYHQHNNFVSAAPLPGPPKGLMRTSKSQPNLLLLLVAQPPHGHLNRARQNQSRNSVATTQKLPRRSDDRTKNYDDDDNDGILDDYDDELVKTKKERVAQWLMVASDIAEPPTCPPEIEDDFPPQRDNAIHIVYNGD